FLYQGLDGLIVLLDTAYSGIAAFSAMQRMGTLRGRIRFEMLTATDDRQAADCCFSRSLVACLRDGIDQVPGEFLRCQDVLKIIKKRCTFQSPQYFAGNIDEGLYLARNWAHTRRLLFSSCFISHSSADKEFARRLHSRMREEGLRVWFDE